MAACALRRQLLAAAVLHWAARLCGAAIAAWREYAAARQRKLALAELADVHRRRRCLAASLAAWRGAVLRLAELRAAAATTIQAALYGGTHQLAGMCLRSWQQHAGRRARLRDAAHLADRLRHYGLLAAVWRSWLLWCAWRRHLLGVHASLQALQPRLQLAFALRRWRAGVAAAQADDGGLCYRG
ncbi:SFI1-like protein [Micractinium conductrix]|uniref:SFI1-like protein n=1 Tax=Micractinium conductrix TaxID=554055 RepID=A0A2P6VFV3_9CHLO|nr:SFI1-like protein [Micractinium conductrix]|eukprot:PSC72975.1 SFI1-like protein [Micractinium conductrix]